MTPLLFVSLPLFLLLLLLTTTTTTAAPGAGGNGSESRDVPDEQRLLARVLRNYNKNVRPVINSNDSVAVTLGFTLIQVMDMVRGQSSLHAPGARPGHGHGKGSVKPARPWRSSWSWTW